MLRFLKRRFSLRLLILAVVIPVPDAPVFSSEPSGASRPGAPTGELAPIRTEKDDWPWWRGPEHNGIARSDQHPPVRWSDTENIVWSARIPGRSHGSPTMMGAP